MRRTILFLVCLALAKVATVYVPIYYRDAVDLLTNKESAALAIPIGILVAYGVMRVLSTAFAELRCLLLVQAVLDRHGGEEQRDGPGDRVLLATTAGAGHLKGGSFAQELIDPRVGLLSSNGCCCT